MTASTRPSPLHPQRSRRRPARRGGRAIVLLLAIATLVATAAPLDPAWANHHTRDSLELEDPRPGWTSEYVFGMSKGVMNSTLEPALKPAVMLLTVPLDLALLPFSAIAGFF